MKSQNEREKEYPQSTMSIECFCEESPICGECHDDEELSTKSHPLDDFETICNQCKYWFDDGKECCKKCQFDFLVCNEEVK
jgi:hypothetical protein